MSKTQLSNIGILVGLLMLILPKFGVLVSQEQLAFLVGATWSVGWTIYNYYQRYQKGDLNAFGVRL